MNPRTRPWWYLAAATPVIIVLVTLAPSGRVLAVTESQVEQACAESKDAYATYRQARADFETAALALEQANARLADAQYQEERIRGMYQARQEEQTALQAEVEAQAVELYMEAATGPSLGMISLTSPSQALTALEFLRSSTQRSQEAVNDLSAVSAELDRLGVDLEAAVSELTTARDQQAEQTSQQEAAMNNALTSYDQLNDECRQLQAEYEAEQARLRAEEERRRREAERAAGGGGGGGGRVGGIICPFTPGRTQFIDSWGYPRSGGRSHKGTDMFAPWEEPVYAVASGTVVTGNYGLGGKIVWLSADNGAAFYYAHLNGWAVSSGQRVEQGQLIAYNGNSGNASGTSPHVHFQIHPNGRGGAAVNPYPTVASVCF